MSRRSAGRRVLWALALIAGAGALLLASLAVWVSVRPLPLDFLKPYVEKALRGEDGSHTVQIDRLDFVWGGWEKPIDLQAHDVKLTRRGGERLGDMRNVSVELSLSDLLRGRISPKSFTIVAPRVLILRPRGGKFRIGEAPEAGERSGPSSRDETELVRHVTQRLFTPPDPHQELGRFRSIGVRHGLLVFDDRERGVSWELADFSMEAVREQDAVRAIIELESDEQHRRSSVSFLLPYEAHQDVLRVRAELTDLDPALLYQILPEMAPFITIENALSGSIEITIPSGIRPVTSDFELRAGGVVAAGSYIIKRDLSAVEMVDLRRFEYAGNSISGTGITTVDGGYDLEISGERFDFEPLVDRLFEGRDLQRGGWARPYKVEIALDEALFGSQEGFHDFSASATFDGTEWQSVKVEAGVGEEARLSLTYAPAGEGHRLDLKTGDAGRVLDALQWMAEIEGGSLELTGTKSGPQEPLLGEVKLRNARVTNAPTVAKILQVVGLTGILSALRKDGLDIKRLGTEFEYQEGEARFRKGYARGSSIGITWNGTVAFEDGVQLDLKGVVVPAHSIQRTVARIPVLGWILAGGKHEGIIGFNYTVRGPVGDPSVRVNPASALTPGFLRKIFRMPRRNRSKDRDDQNR